MSKFKKGDIVIGVRTTLVGGERLVGEIFKVTRAWDDTGPFGTRTGMVDLQYLHTGEADKGWFEDRFELVEPHTPDPVTVPETAFRFPGVGS